MRKRVYLLFCVLAVQLLTGCSAQIKDYVRGNEEEDAKNPSLSSSKSAGYQISNGASLASGTTVKTHFALTASQQKMTGTTVVSKISFNRNRPQ